MTVTKGQLLSTAAAVRHAGLAPVDVKSVTIDGNAVDAAAAEKELSAFEKAIDDAEKKAKEAAVEKAKKPSVFARATSWTRDNVVKPSTDWAHDNVLKPTGDWVKENAPAVATATNATVSATTGIAMSRPEDLDRRSLVKIKTRDGRTVEIPVMVRDELASQIMKATSATVGGIGLVPFFGNFVQGGTGLVAALASGASYMLGDKELGGALLGMAKKHLVMGVVGFVPGVGSVTGIQAAHDMKRLAESDVKVGEIVGP